MTLQELHENEELRNHEFPVTRDKIFLGHAGVCPLPRRIAEAMRSYSTRCMTGDQEETMTLYQIQQTRKLAAELLHVDPEEIALVGPTSLALSFIAGGLRLNRNQEVLVYFDDYPSNVYPWMALAEKGVRIRFLNVKSLGQIRQADVLGQIDENTGLVALASCHFIAGWRIDLPAIAEVLKKKNILFCVDGIQTVGAFPTPMEGVDFLAADAHKWMLGPCGAGVMFVRRDKQEILQPIVQGWHNISCPQFVAQEEMHFKPDARRYEAGTHNLMGMAGMHAAIQLLLEIGIENIASDLLRKRAWLIPGLEEKGCEVLHSDAPSENAGAIISFQKPGEDLPALHQMLAKNQIFTSLRTDRAGNRYIRISPHFYNTDTELQRVLELL